MCSSDLALALRQRKICLEATPLRPQLWVLCLNFEGAQAIENAKVLFAQASSGLAGAGQGAGQRLCGLSRAQQVAAVQMEGLRPVGALQMVTHALRLLVADVVQRNVDLPLKAQGPVPVGFSMANQQQFGGPHAPVRSLRLANKR